MHNWQAQFLFFDYFEGYFAKLQHSWGNQHNEMAENADIGSNTNLTEYLPNLFSFWQTWKASLSSNNRGIPNLEAEKLTRFQTNFGAEK